MTLNLLRPDKPGIYKKSAIYDPAHPTTCGRIVPPVDSIINDHGQFFYVVSVDATTEAATLAPALTKLEAPNSSVISYGNDIFHLYYDNRVTPITLDIEDTCKIQGGEPATYEIIRFPNTAQAVAISAHYGVSGNYLGTKVPMAAVTGVDNTWYFPRCVTAIALTDNEELQINVYNSENTLDATVTVFAKLASVANAAPGFRPRITGIAIAGNQTLGQTQFFVYTRQSIESLFLRAVLTYDDGTTVTVPIDNTNQCFLYGTEDFIASYPGLVQTLLLKYWLSPGELTGDPLNPLNGFISTEVTVTVLPYPTEKTGKISTIPLWDSNTSQYSLRYFYYTLARNAAIDITALVTLSDSSFVGNQYGTPQSLTLKVDLGQVNPSAYPASTIYTQTLVITLQPTSALVRYILRDSLSSPLVYGMDSSVSRRPVIDYDATRNQYFIPAAVFGDLNAFLTSFYQNDNPPFDVTVETLPPQPTHFLLRDATSGAMIIPAMLPITSYATPFNVMGAAGSYVKATVIVEFIQQIGGQNLILWGSPCDVYAATFTG